MYTFCTLFDHNYLSRGIALYNSLKKNCKAKFILYVLATDDIAYNYLAEQNFESLIVQSLNDIKKAYPVLEKLQQERTRAEFSWTLSSFSIQFFMKKYKTESMTYLDSDIYFYNDPKLIFAELSPKESVLITPHNYYYKYDQSETSGRYCVQFIYFKNDKNGCKVLEWWRKACEECCCGVPTNGKFGDQKYLDDWLSRFKGIVHESTGLGIGVAPWNACRFNVIETKNTLEVEDKITKQKNPVIFYHFHGLKEYIDDNNDKYWDYNFTYTISSQVIAIFYLPYTKELSKLAQKCPLRNISKLESKTINYLHIIKQTIKDILRGLLFFHNFKKHLTEEKNKIISQPIKDPLS